MTTCLIFINKVKELAKMLFNHTKQFENKLDCKLKKQEIVFDTAVFHYELTFTNHGYVEHKRALEERKDTSMPIRAGVFFSMFPFCILFEVLFKSIKCLKVST